jgi:phosphatidylserine/phosphatidylglycerophosphate/cardiolipin synthase-like enzyme
MADKIADRMADRYEGLAATSGITNLVILRFERLFAVFRRYRPWLIPFAVGLLLTIGSSLWRITAQSAVVATATPLPQDPYIQAYFNQSEASVYSDPYRHIERLGDNLEQVVIDAIDQSTLSVDLAVQTLNLPLVAQALVRSAQRGVAVRVILENQYAYPTSAKAQQEQRAAWMAIADADRNGSATPAEIAQADALSILRNAHIPELDDTADGSKGSGLMHHKFLVIDGRWVLTGSVNLTLSGVHGDAADLASRGNADVLLKIDSAAIAQIFTAEFNLMWGDGPAQSANSQFGLQKPSRSAQTVALPTGSVTLQFSPLSVRKPWDQSVNGLIARTLSQAQRSIDLALFVFSEQRLVNPLAAQVKAGRALRVLIDPGFIYRNYSEALDMLGVALPDQRCQIEAGNQVWAKAIAPVGSPYLPPGDKLHHKFAVIDHNTVIVGSQNWSEAANSQNDEALLVIRNATVAAHFSREFERLYRDRYTGLTPLLQRKIGESRQRCGE